MTTLEKIFKDLHPKYRELRYFHSTHLNSTDVASLLIKLDEQVFQSLIVTSDKTQRLFLPNPNSGIWEEQHGKHELIKTVNDIRTRIDRMVLRPLTEAEHECGTCDDMKDAKKKPFEETHKLYSSLVFKLGNDTFKNQVIKEIINTAIIRTKEQGITVDTFDNHLGAIGFDDGVYDFNTSRFYTGEQASKFYVTRTVGYEYGDIDGTADDTMGELEDFLKTIHPDADIRSFVLKRLSNSLKGIQEQSILIHYNISGKNGKTTLFKLIKKAFGSYFMKCNVGLLYPSAFNNPGSSNEELVSLKGMLCALFSEPSTKQKLHAAMLKELTGGDEQSTRRNYGSKETFVFNGLAHLLCNKIPELDEYDGGTARRMVCVPYKSTFVDRESEVDPKKHHYLRDWQVDRKFDEWKYCLMKTLIGYSNMTVETPLAVTEHTKRYQERENVMKKFVEEAIEKTGNVKDYVKQTDLYKMYVSYCRENNICPLKKELAFDDFHTELDEELFKAKTNGLTNVWRCYRVKDVLEEVYEDDLEG